MIPRDFKVDEERTDRKRITLVWAAYDPEEQANSGEPKSFEVYWAPFKSDNFAIYKTVSDVNEIEISD